MVGHGGEMLGGFYQSPFRSDLSQKYHYGYIARPGCASGEVATHLLRG